MSNTSFHTTISDRRIAVPSGSNLDHYIADILSSTDYYPFGSPMPGRNSNSADYRFGFNGQEMDNEITGQTGTHTTAMFWEYDSRLGRRWNLDPVVKEYESPYECFGGNPIWFCDPTGADSALAAGSKTWMWDVEKGDTYSGISERTGVSVDNLRAWNKYGDKEIPIGAQLNISDPSIEVTDNPTVDLGSSSLAIRKFQHAQLAGEGFIQPWLEIEGTADFSADELQWLQTYETNDPIESQEQAFQESRPFNPGFYIDASKDKSNYPFYFDKSPNAGGDFGFFDIPRRTPNQQGTVYWKGNLSLIRKIDTGYVSLVTFSWGFEVHSDGSTTTYLLRQTDTPSDFHKQAIESL